VRYLGGPVWRHLLGLAILGATVLFIDLTVDLQETWDALGELSPGWVVLALPLFSLSKLIHAARWRLFLEAIGEPPPLISLFAIFSFSNMANALFPFRAGDVARVELTARRHGLSRTETTATVFVVETLFDGVAFALLLIVALWLGDLPGVSGWLVAVLTGLVIVAVGAGWFFARRASRDAGGRFAMLLGRFSRGLAVFAQPARAGAALGLSLIAWLLEVLTYLCFGEALGMNLDFASYIGVMLAANLLTAVPLTPFNLGVYELGVQGLVEAMGVEPGLALAYAVSSHALLLAWILLSGLLAMAWLGLSAGDLKEPSARYSISS
jgi:glycosyltransferase 2 family protein